VLTHRIAWLIQQGRAEPGELLAVTFTNKAAREMRSRVEHLLNLAAGGIWMGTFHAIGVRILRRDGAADGVDRHFAIYDEGDRLAVVKRIMTEHRLDEKRYPPGGMVGLISRAKDELMTPEEQLKAAGTHTEELAARVRQGYEAFLERNHALDFDDLLLRTVWLFDRPPGGPGALPAAVQVRHGRRVPGHESGPVPDGAPSRQPASQSLRGRRRRPVHLRVPRRGRAQHPVLRARLSGRPGGEAGTELPVDPG